MGGGVGGDVVVAAAEILHECMTSGQDPVLSGGVSGRASAAAELSATRDRLRSGCSRTAQPCAALRESGWFQPPQVDHAVDGAREFIAQPGAQDAVDVVAGACGHLDPEMLTVDLALEVRGVLADLQAGTGLEEFPGHDQLGAGFQQLGECLVPAGPVGAENLCHQAIFVYDTTGAVMPPDPEMIQVSDAIWQRPEWRGLVQGAVRPVGVVEILVLSQHRHQVAQIPDQGPIQQLTPTAANPPLHDRIHSRCLNGGPDDPDADRLEHGIERLREAGVPVMQDELRSHPGILQVHEQVPGLLDDPGLDRVLRGAQDPDASGSRTLWASAAAIALAVISATFRGDAPFSRRNLVSWPGPASRMAWGVW